MLLLLLPTGTASLSPLFVSCCCCCWLCGCLPPSRRCTTRATGSRVTAKALNGLAAVRPVSSSASTLPACRLAVITCSSSSSGTGQYAEQAVP